MCAAAAVRLAAQQSQPAAPAKQDSPAITEQLDRLKKSVGPRWADAVHFWCEAPRANRPDDPVIQPAKLFDNVYAIGNSGTVAYVFNTSAGLVMIDALGANQVESVLLPGFKALGLGKVVGVPTMGAVIGTGAATLLDGSTIRTPGSGVWTSTGENMENFGVPPDVYVDNTPEDFLNRRDAQVEKAVEVLKGELSAKKSTTPSGQR